MRYKIIQILEEHQQLLGEDIGVGASMYGVVADKIIEMQQQPSVKPEVKLPEMTIKELYDRYTVPCLTEIKPDGYSSKDVMEFEQFKGALQEYTQRLLMDIQVHIEQIWIDCFDSPATFNDVQWQAISSAIKEVKLKITLLGNKR